MFLQFSVASKWSPLRPEGGVCVYLYSVYGVWLWRMFRNVILEQKMVNNLLSLESISIDAIIISVFRYITLEWFRIQLLWRCDMSTWQLVPNMITNIPSHSDDLCLHLPLRARHLKFTGYSRRHWKSDLTGPPLHGYPDVRLLTLIAAMYDKWDLNVI